MATWAAQEPQPDGSLLSVSGTYRQRSSTLAALGRYTLTRTLSHRLQVDLLGGVSAHHLNTHNTRSSPDPATPTGWARAEYRFQGTNPLLTAGASIRYRVSAHLEAVADATVSAPLGRTSWGTRALALGLRYRFNLGAH